MLSLGCHIISLIAKQSVILVLYGSVYLYVCVSCLPIYLSICGRGQMTVSFSSNNNSTSKFQSRRGPLQGCHISGFGHLCLQYQAFPLYSAYIFYFKLQIAGFSQAFLSPLLWSLVLLSEKK